MFSIEEKCYVNSVIGAQMKWLNSGMELVLHTEVIIENS